jgi:arylsulfatase A-like enzyme
VAMGLCLTIQPLLGATAVAQQPKPNILFILADNTGYGDLGVYGGGELRGAPTPRIDRLAAEGLRLTQFLVEPACTPSRGLPALGNHQEGVPGVCRRDAVELVKALGLRLAVGVRAEMPFAKNRRSVASVAQHLGHGDFRRRQRDGSTFNRNQRQSGADGIAPSHQRGQDPRHGAADRRGQAGRAAEGGEALYCGGAARHRLVIKRQKAGGKPFFLYLPISRTHYPNLPSKRFEGQSRIGQFGDSLMEGDAMVGRMLEALDELGLARETIVVFASDNGPQGEVVREFGGDMPDMGSPGPFRGELGDVSEGSIRTAAIIRWPDRIRPRSSNAMFSIMDFFPTFARFAGGEVPDDRPIDGVDQSDLLLGARDAGRRDHLLTFVGPDLVAARWKQFRAYFADVAPGRSGWGGANLLPGTGGSAAPMNGYPRVFNIESDPREEHNIGAMYEWVIGPVLKMVEQYKATPAQHPNPPAANMTRF